MARLRLWFSFVLPDTFIPHATSTLLSKAPLARPSACARAFCRGCYHLRETRRSEQRRERGQGWGLKRGRGRRREKERKTGTGTEVGWETRRVTETGKDTEWERGLKKGREREREWRGKGEMRRTLVSAASENKKSKRPGTAILHAASSL